ncbi:hypothetical protein COLO4_18129 [Corchorus olitorius]|uniref:F-box associated beta-propeller type 3 domain-containing protein n=1 Tax=Corchorus olitorius TaxID=93759 RepID=A0A1R3JA79_9ROSI|nr:hypothetical protein COLO4_18129 [Corchorus olitorius]
MTSCRLLSQHCNSLSYDSNFINLHCQRTNTIAGYFLQTLHHDDHYSTFVSVDNSSSGLTLDFLPCPVKDIEIVACSDGGLILCKNTLTWRGKYYICKPSSKQFETIPNPIHVLTKNVIGIGLMVLGLNPLRFKVVRIFEPYNHDEEKQDLFKYEVFDSEIWEWNPPKDLFLPFSLLPKKSRGLSVYGGLHWLTMSEKNTLSFFEDYWVLVPLPESKTEDALFSSVRTRLTKYEGKLGVIYEKSERSGIEMVELWIMKQDCNGKGVWSKKHQLNFEACNNEQQNRDCSVLCFYNPDIVLMTGFGFVIFYNFKTGRFKRVELDSIYKYAEDAVFVHTDVEPIIFNLKAQVTDYEPIKSIN